MIHEIQILQPKSTCPTFSFMFDTTDKDLILSKPLQKRGHHLRREEVPGGGLGNLLVEVGQPSGHGDPDPAELLPRDDVGLEEIAEGATLVKL